jgi:DNA repair protein RecO (recombination protein O)
MLTKDFAICIQASDFSETSQVLTFFGRQSGKIRCIAKGSKRQKSAFDGPVEIFAYGQLVFTSSSEDKLATLTEFQQQKPFSELAKNLPALNSAMFAVELLNKFTKDYDPHPRLFDAFLQFLQNINEIPDTRYASLSFLILFQLSLLKEIGLQPVLDKCVNCKTSHEPPNTSDERRGTSDETYFSSSANGLICKNCEPAFPDKVKLSAQSAKGLKHLKLIADADEKTLNEIERVLIYHFTELLNRPPKMAKYFLKT